MSRSEHIANQIADHARVVEALKNSADVLEQAAQLIIDAFKAGHRLYVVGNGGSAADAQHIAAEMVGRFKGDPSPALPAVALTTDTSNLTAISNDFGYEVVFARQVQALVQPGDVLWALSVSGTSANVLKAVELARQEGARIIGFSGQGGAALQDHSDVCFMAEHTDSDRVQEAHQLAYHVICGLVEQAFGEAS